MDFRQPNITGNDHEMLLGIRSYLYQLREQLQYFADNIEGNGILGGGGGITNNTTTIINQGASVPSESRPPTEEEAELTFNAIKSFIVKSADIVESYYKQIDSMILSEGKYVATTDFEGYKADADDKYVDKADYNTYVAEVNSRLDVHSTDIEVNHTYTETIKAELDAKIDEDVGKVDDKLNEYGNVYQYEKDYALIRKSQGYIKAGFLGETSERKKEYGIEIGLEESDGSVATKSIGRFSSERVVLYDQNGQPGAELNNNSLLADNVVIEKKQQTGMFIDTVDARGNITTKWIGDRSV